MVRNQSFHMKKPIKCGLANHQSPSIWHQHPFYPLAKTAADSALFTWLTGQDFMFEICSNRNLSSSGMKLLVVHGMGSICISQFWIFSQSRIRFPSSHQASQYVSQNVLSSSSLPQHLKEVSKILTLHFQALLAGAPDLSLSSSVPPTPDSETLAAFAREIKVQKMLLVLLSLVFILLPLQERLRCRRCYWCRCLWCWPGWWVNVSYI